MIIKQFKVYLTINTLDEVFDLLMFSKKLRMESSNAKKESIKAGNKCQSVFFL